MAQGIQIGDAVLKVFVDWTELNNIATDLPGKMKPGTDAVASLGQKLDSVGESAVKSAAKGTDAFKGMGDEFKKAGDKAKSGFNGFDQIVDKQFEAWDGLTPRIKTAGTAIDNAGRTGEAGGRRMADGMREARGEAALLGELTGVRLPRHARNFIATLPGVSAALSTAFEATAIIFLIEALVQLEQKIEQFIEKPQRIANAWDKYAETVFESGEKIRGEIDKQEQKLVEMREGPVAALDFALRHLQTTAFETFKSISADITDAVAAMREQAGFGNVFGDAAKDLEQFEKQLQKTMREAQRAHPEDPFVAYNAAVSAVQQKERDLTALIHQRELASGKSSEAATSGLHAERQAVNALLPLIQRGIELDKDRQKTAEQDKSVAISQQQAEAAKRVFDTRIAQINQERADQQLLYSESKIGANDWAKAQVNAAFQAQQAQLAYKEALLAAAKISGDATKIQAAGQELTLEKLKQQTAATLQLAQAWAGVKLAQQQLTTLVPLLQTVQETASTALTRSFNSAEEAAKTLGFTLAGDLYGNLEKAKQAYIDLKNSGVASYGDLLRAQLAVLKLRLDWDSSFKNNAAAVAEDRREIKQYNDELQKLAGLTPKAEKGVKSFFERMHNGDILSRMFAKDMESSSKGMRIFGTVANEVSQDFGAAWESAFASAILGQQSFGEALAAATAQVLAQIAAQALVYGIFYTAQGIADLFWNPARAGADFAAAGEFFAVGAAAGLAAHAINPTSGSSSYDASANTAPSGPNAQAGGQPTQSTNAYHLASGGLVRKRQVVVVGDAPNGGDQEEAVLPLKNTEAIGKISDAILGPMIAAFSGIHPSEAAASVPSEIVGEMLAPQPFSAATVRAASEVSAGLSQREITRAVQETHHHYETLHVSAPISVTGVYSDGNLHKLAPKIATEISRQVKAGKTRLVSSDSFKNTKRV